MTPVPEWTTEHPTICGYYWATPKDRAEWLDNWPEVVYVSFDGRWCVYRPLSNRTFAFSFFSHWCGLVAKPVPFPPPGLLEESEESEE